MTTISFQNKQIYKHLFDNVTCETENPELSHTIKRDIYNRSIYIHCYNTSEIHNVTRTTDGKVELYCGIFFSISVFLNKQNNTDLTQRRWREPKSDSKCPLRSLGSALGLLCKQKTKETHVRLPHVSPSSPKVCLLNWSVLFWCSLYPFTNEAKQWHSSSTTCRICMSTWYLFPKNWIQRVYIHVY